MLSAEQVQKFKQQGYLLGEQVLDDDQVERLRVEMLRVIEQSGKTEQPQPVLCRNMGSSNSPVWQIINIWMASEAFRELVFNSTVCEQVAQLHDGANELRMWHDQIQYKPAGTGGVNMWHQDSPYWGILTPKYAQVTAWIALDDVDTSNGCMSMVRESHLWGNAIPFLNTIKDFEDMQRIGQWEGHPVRVVSCPVRKGHVHFHHSMVWHGSRANTSNQPRRAIALHYMTDQTRYVASGSHPMKQFVTVADGEVLGGAEFPVVWRRTESLINS
jgi:ectoine hydroxylase-related dioxygenase (phytanoyl-CoA dioxygenase family)